MLSQDIQEPNWESVEEANQLLVLEALNLGCIVIDDPFDGPTTTTTRRTSLTGNDLRKDFVFIYGGEHPDQRQHEQVEKEVEIQQEVAINREYCGSNCKTCKGCHCSRTGLACITGKCQCGSGCTNKKDNRLNNEWIVGGKFDAVEISESPYGPINVSKDISYKESSTLIWDSEIVDHIHKRTNFKKQYCIDFSSQLVSYNLWSKNNTKLYNKSKVTKKKYSHINGTDHSYKSNNSNIVPSTSQFKQPKFESFEQYFNRMERTQLPAHFSKEEIRVFFLIVDIMTLNNNSEFCSFWLTSGIKAALFANKLIQKLMSRRRFLDIKKHLTCDPNFVEDKVNDNSRKYWTCKKYVSVDEIMEAFKGKVRFKQYLPLKPHKYGLKYYALSDSTGYIYGYWLYKGTESRHAHNPSSIVLDLLKHIPKPENHLLGIDNYYGSLDLAKSLSDAGWHFVMTVRNNRPTYLFSNGLQLTLKEKGQWNHAVNKEREIVAVVMYDSKRVNFLTNVASNQQDAKPLVQQMYNKSMGGVDKSGIYLHSSIPPFRNKSWKIVDLIHHFKTANVNQFLIYKTAHNSTTRQKDYLMKVLEESLVFKNPYFDRLSHFPTQISRCQNCEYSHKKCTKCKRKAQVCAFCKKKNSGAGFECKGCSKVLHLRCFIAYHNQKLIFY